MIEAVISKSPNKDKKFKVVVTDGKKKKTIHFGAKGYEDYTTSHKDDERKKRYIARHSGLGEDYEDPYTAGFWAMHTLWNKKTLPASLKDIKDRFNIKIKKNL